MTREAVANLESTVADVRRDYDAKFALIAQSASDAQAKVDDAVARAVQAKQDEDDAAFNQATSELKDIMASHVQAVADSTPAPAPATDPSAPAPAADPTPAAPVTDPAPADPAAPAVQG